MSDGLVYWLLGFAIGMHLSGGVHRWATGTKLSQVLIDHGLLILFFVFLTVLRVEA